MLFPYLPVLRVLLSNGHLQDSSSSSRRFSSESFLFIGLLGPTSIGYPAFYVSSPGLLPPSDLFDHVYNISFT